MAPDSKPGASFDAASISTSTSSIMTDKEKAQAEAHAQANKKPSLLKRAVTGTVGIFLSSTSKVIVSSR